MATKFQIALLILPKVHCILSILIFICVWRMPCVHVIVSVHMCRDWRLMSSLSIPPPPPPPPRIYWIGFLAKLGIHYFGWTGSGEAPESSCFCFLSSPMMCAVHTCYCKWILGIQTHVFTFTLQALDWLSQLPRPGTHVYRIDHLMPREMRNRCVQTP